MSNDGLDYDDIEDTRNLKPPPPHELPLRVLAVERAARHRRSVSEQAHKASASRDEILGARLDKIEKMAIRLGAGIAAATLSVAVTVVSSAIYVGARFERIEGTALTVSQHDRRIERLEEKAMARD